MPPWCVPSRPFTTSSRFAQGKVKGLEGTHQGGIRYPIPVYQRFEPQFPKSYQELQRMWDETAAKENR